MSTFSSELKSLLNRHSKENGSDTPDFILAKYLEGCLDAWNSAVKDREKWYGRGSKPASELSTPNTRLTSREKLEQEIA